jgi:hypothetical protein
MTDDRAREIAVETVEMMDWSDPANPQPSDLVFRIVLHGYVADFDSKPAAENFAQALTDYGDARAAEAERAGREAAAAWHELRSRQTPDAFEQEFHEVSRDTILALLDALEASEPTTPPEAEGC